MGKKRRLALLALSGLGLFLAGSVLGFAAADRTRGLYPTESFVEERLAECDFSLAVYESAEESPRAQWLLAGDLAACNVLIEMWPNKVDAKHRELADEIRAAHQQAQADNAARSQ